MGQDKMKCCGNCCWFYAEDTYGYGSCPFCFGDVKECSDYACKDNFISRQQMRHHLAVLLQFNRYRRDQHDPPLYRIPDPKEIGEAIDFAYRYIKTFSEL